MEATLLRLKRFTLIASSLSLIMVMLNVSIVNTALPAIQEAFGAGTVALQWVVNAYNLVFASLLLLGGLLGDRFGHRRVLLFGIGIGIGGAVLAGLAPTIGVLIAARAVQGLGSAIAQPATLAIITYTFTNPQERARAIGLWGAVSGIGIALGPISGGVLVDTLGWRAVFAAIVPVGLIAALPTIIGVQETPQTRGKTLDIPGLLLIVCALTALSLGLSYGQTDGLTSALPLALFAGAFVAFAAFIAVERRAAHPLVELSAFRNSTFTVANLGGLLAFFGTFPLLTYLTIYLQRFAGLSATQAGLIILLFPLAFAAGSPLGARLINRFGPRAPIVFGLLCSAVGALSLLTLSSERGPWNTWWSIALLGVGVGLSLGALTQAAVSSVGLERAGMASSLLGALRQVGTALGIALLGTLITSGSTAAIERDLRALPIPSDTHSVLSRALADGRTADIASIASNVDAQVLQRTAGDGFIAGLHSAFLAAGIVLLTGAALALRFIGGAQPRDMQVRLPQRAQRTQREER
jgi:EmrB/QacA subfamily drug resistance transporter